MGLSLTVMTLNLHKGFNSFNRRFVLHELRDAIHAIGADLVFLQEVIGAHDAHARRYERWPDATQYEFLADTIWSSFAYGRNAVYEGGHHGNAILSKFPIVTHVNRDISVGLEEPRGLLHCEIALPGEERPLHAICAHLGLRESERQAQISTAVEMIHRETRPGDRLIMAGDFNDWRQRAHGPLRLGARLQDVFVQSAGRAARSFPALWPLLRLDRIYVRNLRASGQRVLSRRPWRRLSDHAALICDLQPC
jgi:endonuclease/exonuclease/phosphatase family metal-dependent hydrolase